MKRFIVCVSFFISLTVLCISNLFAFDFGDNETDNIALFTLNPNGSSTLTIGMNCPLYVVCIIQNLSEKKELEIKNLSELKLGIISKDKNKKENIDFLMIFPKKLMKKTILPLEKINIIWKASSPILPGKYEINISGIKNAINLNKYEPSIRNGQFTIKESMSPTPLCRHYQRILLVFEGKADEAIAGIEKELSQERSHPGLELERIELLLMAKRTKEARDALYAIYKQFKENRKRPPCFLSQIMFAIKNTEGYR